METFETDYETFALDPDREPAFGFPLKYDPKRHGFPIVIDEIAPMPVEWGLIIGDVTNNFRSSLDHLAWALVKRGKTPNLPEKRLKDVYFPIANSPAAFRKVMPKMLPGVRRADVAVVRRYQPYRAGKRNMPVHPLMVLAQLSTADKHRTVQPVWALPTSARIEVSYPYDCTVTRIPSRARTARLQVGREITCIYVRKTGPDPDIQVNVNLTAKPAIIESVFLQEWLRQTGGAIFRLLKEFAEPPSKVKAWRPRSPSDGAAHPAPLTE